MAKSTDSAVNPLLHDQEDQTHALTELRAKIDKAEASGPSEQIFSQAIAQARREAGID